MKINKYLIIGIVVLVIILILILLILLLNCLEKKDSEKFNSKQFFDNNETTIESIVEQERKPVLEHKNEKPYEQESLLPKGIYDQKPFPLFKIKDECNMDHKLDNWGNYDNWYCHKCDKEKGAIHANLKCQDIFKIPKIPKASI